MQNEQNAAAHLAALQTLRSCGKSCEFATSRLAVMALGESDLAAVRQAVKRKSYADLARLAVRFAENTGRN